MQLVLRLIPDQNLNKYFFRLLPIVIICIAVVGCKKEEAPNPENFGYLTTGCRLASWGMFFSKYDSDNRLTEIYNNVFYFPATPATELYRTLEYENGELKRIIVPKFEPKEVIQERREAWTEVEYEYGQYGVTTIRKFGYEGMRNGKIARIETSRHEFKYNNSRKPVELLTYAYYSREVDYLRVRGKRTFEYDSKGNLSNEISESIIDGKVESTLPIKYYYDDYPNTTKVLNFIDFDYIEAHKIFSTNNPIRVEYPGQVIDFNLTYDDHRNVIGKSPEMIKWDCK